MAENESRMAALSVGFVRVGGAADWLGVANVCGLATPTELLGAAAQANGHLGVTSSHRMDKTAESAMHARKLSLKPFTRSNSLSNIAIVRAVARFDMTVTVNSMQEMCV
jgi:hypothetical protein